MLLECPEAIEHNKELMDAFIGNEDSSDTKTGDSNKVYNLLQKFEKTYDTLIDQVVSA